MKKLNFGCGNDIRKGWDNADLQEGKGIITINFDIMPYPIASNTYDVIEARQILNFTEKPDAVLNELNRISKPNCIISILVPYYNNKGAYNDIQTKHWFNENSFINFVNKQPCRVETAKIFEILEINKEPTIVGKFMPRWFREKLDLFVSGLISNISLKLKVVKNGR